MTQVLDAAAADLEKLKNDSEVLDLINTYNTEEEITPEMLDELISQINSMKEEEDIAKIKLVAMYGMNEDATALGAYLGATAEDEQLKVAELNAEMNDDKVNGAARFGVEEERCCRFCCRYSKRNLRFYTGSRGRRSRKH